MAPALKKTGGYFNPNAPIERYFGGLPGETLYKYQFATGDTQNFIVTVHGVCRYEHEREMLRKNRDWLLFCLLKRLPVPAFSLKRPAIFYEEPP